MVCLAGKWYSANYTAWGVLSEELARLFMHISPAASKAGNLILIKLNQSNFCNGDSSAPGQPLSGAFFELAAVEPVLIGAAGLSFSI